jgi:hypothetical protein
VGSVWTEFPLSLSKPLNDTLLYFNGVINYELNNITKAQKSFSELSSTSGFYDRAQYRLILTYLKLDDKSNAVNELKKALNNSNSIYYEKLQSLEKELVK